MIKPKKNAKILPSSAIHKEKLSNCASILDKCPHLCTESKIATPATKLAREVFVGEKVMDVGSSMDYPSMNFPS